jgi:signal transduction histidine kinase
MANKQKDESSISPIPSGSGLAGGDILTRPVTADTDFLRAQLLRKSVQSLLNAEMPEQVWALLRAVGLPLLGANRMAIFYAPETETDDINILFTDNLSNIYLHAINRHIAAEPIFAPWQLSLPLVLNELLNSELAPWVKKLMLDEGFQHTAAFPLIPPEGHPPGVLMLYRDGERPFTPTEVNQYHHFASLIALTLHRLDGKKELSAQLQRAKRLSEIFAYIHSVDSIPDILSNVVNMAAELLNADAGLLGLLIGPDLMSFYPYNLPRQVTLRPLHKNDSHPWQIVDKLSPIINNNFTEESDQARSWIQADVQALLGVPILTGFDCFGAINVFHLRPDRAFSDEDCRLLADIGEQAGIAIRNLRSITDASQRSTALDNALKRLEKRDLQKNKFVQSVSHELRSPLSIVYGHAELLNSGDLGELSDAQKQSTSIIMRRVNMLTNLVDDLSALLAAETQEFRREEINPIILFYSLLADYRMQADERKLILQADIADELPMIMGDPNHLRRVFDNLLSNAFKYTAPGGNVKIKAWAEGSQVFIEISDTGEGIPAEHLPRIFERFYQVTDSHKPRRKGTGLGLSLVKEIVEAHRGTISVQSKEEMGTAFTITLPTI